MIKKTGLVVILSVILVSCNSGLPPQADDNVAVEEDKMWMKRQDLPITATVEINREKINLEVAQTPRQLAIGLMFRDEVPPDRGMLFPFQPPTVVSFWMRNVTIPLDMIFLRNGVVEYIEHNAPPCVTSSCPVYGPNVKIDMVLELAGGRAKELNLSQGDRLNFQPISQKSE